MIEIVKKGKVDKAIIKVWPGWMETSKSIRSSELTVPASFTGGEKWEQIHTCNHCGNTVAIGSGYGNENYIAGTGLHIAKLQDQAFLDQIGQLFEELELVNITDENGTWIYYYHFPKVSGTASWFTYYKCRHCHTQYMNCYSTIYGKERPPEPDSIYLIAIVEVVFDEAAFLKTYKASFKKV